MVPDLSLCLSVAGASTACSLLVGVGAGYALRRKPWAATLAGIPLALPPAIFCAWFLVPRLTWPMAAAAGALYAFPFLTRSSRIAFGALDRKYADAARTLGASEWRIFWRIALPLRYKPIAAAAAIVFARVFAEMAAVLYLANRMAVRS